MKQLQTLRLERIPHPPRWPLIGNIPDLRREATFIESLTALAKKYGPLIELDLPDRKLLLASSNAIVQEICDESRFEKAVDGPAVLAREIVGDGLFTAYNDEPAWSVAHNVLMPAFSLKSMQAYVPIMTGVARRLLHKWDSLPAGEEIPVSEDMTRMSLDTIALCGFGFDLKSFERSEPHPFVQALMRVLANLQAEAERPPFLVKLLRPFNRGLKRDTALMNGLVDDIIQHRRNDPVAMAESRDLLSAMLTGVDSRTGARISDVNARFQALTFLVAGHESTSGLLTFALYLLTRHPEILARAYEEVDRVLGMDLSQDPTYSQIMALTYCRQILSETLRLWPPFPQIARRAKADTVLGGKYPVSAGQPILINIFAAQRDPAAWGEDADGFNPDRFTPEAEAARAPHAFIGFGTGPRACIGRQLAMVEATLTLAMLLQRYELSSDPNYQLQLIHSLALRPRNFKLRIEKRTRRPSAAVAASPNATAGPVEAPIPTVTVRHETPLCVLYGSNMGTTREFATRVAEQGIRLGYAASASPLDAAVGKLPKAGALIILSASYNGLPPDNAALFLHRLNDGARIGDELKGIPYAVFGCGHSDWAATFQAVPRAIDARLAALGATRLMDRGDGDARGDLEGAFEAWRRVLWQRLAECFRLESPADDDAAAASPMYAIDLLEDRTHNASAASSGAVSMEVLGNRELQRRDGPGASDRSTRHLDISLPAGVSYRAGDHLGVLPRNSERLVGRVAARFKIGRDTHIRLRLQSGARSHLPIGVPVSAWELLSACVELQSLASRHQIRALAEHTACPYTRRALLKLAGEDGADEHQYLAEIVAAHCSVLDLLERYPKVDLPLAAFLGMLLPLGPRYYSISSSPRVLPGAASITVGVLEGPARNGGGQYQGVCSCFLRDALPGSRIQVFVRDNGTFRMPEDASTPLLMVGPGTGIAPFRGFLQERLAIKAAGVEVGRALLFFGCRHPEQDFLYQDELEHFVKHGVVELHTAFSRVQGQDRVYVQQRIAEQKDVVWQLLEQGAVIYVCGDVAQMEPGVRAVLCGVHQEKTGGSEADARSWLEALRASGRYRTDVWTSSR